MFVIRARRDDSYELKTVFAYKLVRDELVIDEARCDDGFMSYLREVMRAKFTRNESGRLTAPAHYHDVFEEVFQTLPYALSDEGALKALGEDSAPYHNSSPPQHVA